MHLDLKDKVVLITGSSQGIGLATSKLLISHGAKVIINSSNPKTDLAKIASEIGASDHCSCDVTKDDQVKAMVEGIQSKFGQIDGLVNNAGGGGWASITDPDIEWQKSFNLDLMATVHTCRYVLPHMQKQKSGSVVNITSMWGINNTAKASIASYCAMKAALEKLTQCLAQDYAPHVRVNAVAPGWTKTPMLTYLLQQGEEDFMKSETLLNRIAEPEEIAQVITFLLGKESSYITGQSISADGGYLLKRAHPPE